MEMNCSRVPLLLNAMALFGTNDVSDLILLLIGCLSLAVD